MRPAGVCAHLMARAAGPRPRAFGSRKKHPPLPPPVSPRRQRARRRWRLLLVLLLLLLTLAVIGSIVVSALGGPQGIASLGHLTANLSITPRHQDIPNNYLINGVISHPPDAAKREVDARTIPLTSDTKQGQGSPSLARLLAIPSRDQDPDSLG